MLITKTDLVEYRFISLLDSKYDLIISSSEQDVITKLNYRYRVIVNNIGFACDPTTTSIDVGYITPDDFDWDGVFDIVDFDDYSDWIEIYNPIDTDVSLKGFALSDDAADPFKWRFPGSAVLPAGKYLVVFASGNDEVINGEYHTNFSLSANDDVIMNRRLGIKSDMDFIVRIIEEAFCGDSSLFFERYRRYKYGVLKLNEGITGLESISRNYLGPIVMESHPGFLELFNAMFKDFLFYYSRTPDGKGLINHINRTHNLDSVRYIIGQHPAVWNDTLTDMVLLQELSRLFYTGEFHKKAILILLEQNRNRVF